MITPYITPFEFGAVGDCNGVSNLGTDDTAAIQTCIDTALASGIRNIYLGNHRITDLNITNITGAASGDGLQFFSMNRKNAYQSGISNLFVSGSTSQGIDLSGSSNIIFNGITISGDSTAGSIPRCAIFHQRTIQPWGGDYAGWDNRFVGVIITGKFQYAGIYNFGGEGWIFDRCGMSTDSGLNVYLTSKNSWNTSMQSKFATPSYGLQYVATTTATGSSGITSSQTTFPVANASVFTTTSGVFDMISGAANAYTVERISYTGKAASSPSILASDTNVNLTTNSIVWNSHGLQTGYAVKYTGTAISELTNGTIYYVVVIDSNTLKLTTSNYIALNTPTSVIDLVTKNSAQSFTLTPQILTGCVRGLGGTPTASYGTSYGISNWNYNFHDMSWTRFTNCDLATWDHSSPVLWAEGAINTWVPVLGYCSGTTVTITAGSGNMKLGEMLLDASGNALGRIVSGSGSSYQVSIGGTYGSSGTPLRMYIPNITYTVTASCSGTTLTTTGSPYLTVGMTIYVNGGYGGIVSLGSIVSGSGDSWQVSIGGTYTNQTMEVSDAGYLDFNNTTSRIRIRDTYVRTSYSPYAILLKDCVDSIVIDGINEESDYTSPQNTTDAFCKVVSSHVNAPLVAMSYGNSVCTAPRAIRVSGIGAIRNFSELGSTNFVNGGTVI